jgi:choline dehydrogenase-like flavoprotein
MTLRPHSIVTEILYDKRKHKAKGVLVLDSERGELHRYKAKVIFLCASTLNSTFILLNSRSSTFPEGLGNHNGVLGHYLMDHHAKVGAVGVYDGFKDKYYKGRKPNNVVIPRFQNLDKNKEKFTRGYMLSGAAIRTNWDRGQDIPESIKGIGVDLKDKLTKPNQWKMWLIAYGECLPYKDNRVYLNSNDKDKWGLPKLEISCDYGQNEKWMREHAKQSAHDVLTVSGFKEVISFNAKPTPGAAIHEMGTARMGKNAKDSVLNQHNQLHEVSNVFVTDGACMTSSACQNPSLTYMALTARAVDYAVKALKNNTL